MENLQLLLLSNTKPECLWRLARRIERTVPQAKISAIVHQPSRQPGCTPPRREGWLRTGVRQLGHLLLRWAHACPANPNGAAKFTVNNLVEECQRAHWPVLISEDFQSAEVLAFVRRQAPDLGLIVGSPRVDSTLLAVPHRGSLRIHTGAVDSEGKEIPAARGELSEGRREVRVAVELVADGSTASPIAAINIPAEPYDTPAGLTLKRDLVANDLLVRTVASFATGTAAQAMEQVNMWVRKMYPRYFMRTSGAQPASSRSGTPQWRNRPVWKLCIQTFLLFSPYVILRNWYRRLRGRFPIIIFYHHLVSDRPHPMGIPTEIFWRAVQFLQKHYRVVSLAEAIQLLRSGPIKTPTVVLTFDDGYEDNFMGLRAVAEETGIPITVFVCTQVVEERREFEHDRVNGERGFLPMSWDQTRYWSDQGVEIGSHTRSHFDCGASNQAALEEEIVGSREDLERHLGKPTRFLAFPCGKAENMSPMAIRLARSSYECCFSTLGGENFPGDTDAGQPLGRKGLPADLWELELSLQSVFELVRRAKRGADLREKRASPAFS